MVKVVLRLLPSLTFRGEVDHAHFSSVLTDDGNHFVVLPAMAIYAEAVVLAKIFKRPVDPVETALSVDALPV